MLLLLTIIVVDDLWSQYLIIIDIAITIIIVNFSVIYIKNVKILSKELVYIIRMNTLIFPSTRTHKLTHAYIDLLNQLHVTGAFLPTCVLSIFFSNYSRDASMS